MNFKRLLILLTLAAASTAGFAASDSTLERADATARKAAQEAAEAGR